MLALDIVVSGESRAGDLFFFWSGGMAVVEGREIREKMDKYLSLASSRTLVQYCDVIF
jgi:hypothetical protein